MPQIGSFTLLLALALAAYSFLAGVLALFRKDDRLGETARRAGIASWAAVTIAGIALVMAALGNDFSVAYILHHSNRDLPIAYKFAALWSGQEGSLLFWAWLLSSYALVLRLRYKVDPQLTAYASAIIAAVQVFFLLLINFAARSAWSADRSPPTVTASIRCCNIRRWSSIRQCSISATSASPCRSLSPWAR